MDGIFRWIRLRLDERSARRMEQDAQAALQRGTDPKVPVDNLHKIENGFKSLATAMRRYAPWLATALSIREVIKATAENELALARLDTMVRNTGEGAGYTTEQLANMSVAMSRASTTASAAVQTGLARLLAYTNIQGEQFERAAQATLDMSEALGIDMVSAAETLGVALDNPILGLGRLSRQGFIFTEQQKALIQSFVDLNDLASAQNVILDIVGGTYEDAALKARKTLGGALQALKNEWGDQIALNNEASSTLVEWINAITNYLPTARIIVDDFFFAFRVGGVRALSFIDRVDIRLQRFLNRYFSAITDIDIEASEQRFLDLQIKRERQLTELVERREAFRAEVSKERGPLGGYEIGRVEEINQATAATNGLIASLEKERDALKYSRWELIERSAEYQNATATQQEYIRTLFEESELLQRQSKIRDDLLAKEMRSQEEKKRTEMAVVDTIRAMERELDVMGMTRREVLMTSQAFMDATQAQRDHMLAIYDAVEARKQQIETEREALRNMQDLADAFQPFFDGMIYGLLGVGYTAEETEQALLGFGATVVAQMVEGKAEMSMAEALSALASGTWPPNPAALKAASLHFAAAAAFRGLSGYQSRKASMSASSMGASSRISSSSIAERQAPEINIYIDPLNPSNPAWQSSLAQTLRGVTQRYGSTNVNVRPRTA